MPQFYRTEPVVPQLPNPLESVGQALQLKQLVNRGRAQDQDIQQSQQQQRESQMVMQELARTQGDWQTALKNLTGKISPQTQLAFEDHFQKRLKAADDARKSRIDADKSGLDLFKAKNEQKAELVAEAWQLTEQELAARTDEFVTRAKAIDPELQVPPGPLTHDTLKAFGVMLAAEQYTAHIADAKSKAEKSRYDALAAKKEAELGYKPTAPLPGRDVPFSPEVQEQKVKIARESRPPRGQGGPPLIVVQTQDEAGNPIAKIVRKEEGAQFAAPPTADTQNAKFRTQKIVPAINAIKGLGDKVITEKAAIVQRAKASGRKVESVLGDDPDFKAYQAARFALAGNLAVAQQGSRPSDADIFRVWLPLVPDEFSDTQNSAALKWELILKMSGLEPGGGAQGKKGGGAGPGVGDTREYQGATYKFDGKQWVKQ